jgi:hypothetical protein
MLQNILNLNGVTVLGKKQLQALSGGQSCTFTTINSTGARLTHVFDNFSEGSQGSTEANNVCVQAIENSNGAISRCFYDCEWDD